MRVSKKRNKGNEVMTKKSIEVRFDMTCYRLYIVDNPVSIPEIYSNKSDVELNKATK